MRSLNTKELLDVWEHSLALSSIERSLQLLSVASSAPDVQSMARLSIGQRDIRLLLLREWLFGSRLVNTAVCPQCQERVEWENQIKELHMQTMEEKAFQVFSQELNEFKLSYRLPTSQDLLSVIHTNSQDLSRDLLARCILEIEKEGRSCELSELPDKIIAAINQRMNDQDPQADISILLTCPTCACQWRSVFDIGSYLWTEINAWALRLLQDVFVLAKSFGWSENDILSMSPQRRQLYLEIIRA